ncbi:SNF5 [Blepharisma stoltei]|uniref:Uncharacterized protein n=1 Tax=Blepharisma stoltei TaxID=1481888 RepID=A0AAU9KEQ8_9CILI|nr:unnamed protein product [Blepharisma stoltei]
MKFPIESYLQKKSDPDYGYPPSKSLKQLSEQALKKTYQIPRQRKKSLNKVKLCPQAPGCISMFPSDSLAPIKLTINGNPEFFLWHTSNTDLNSEFIFSLQLLNDLGVNLPRPQLLDFASKCAMSIREQVQQYRDSMGGKHCVQGLPGEHLVPLQFAGQGFQWDIACPENSPEFFAKILCQDMELPANDCPSISFKLRSALKAHKMRLAKAFNDEIARIPDIKMHVDEAPSLDQLEIENSIQESLPPPHRNLGENTSK